MYFGRKPQFYRHIIFQAFYTLLNQHFYPLKKTVKMLRLNYWVLHFDFHQLKISFIFPNSRSIKFFSLSILYFQDRRKGHGN